MLQDEIIEFFKQYPPFSFLQERDIAFLIEDVSIEYYPKGSNILTQEGPPTEYLRIIKKGAVKVFIKSDKNEEIIIDFRSEGELFGFISMVSGDRSRANVVAIEDTICYLIPKERIISIVQTNPSFNEYFLRSFFINFIDKTYEETKKRFSLIGESERLLFTTPVGDLVKREPVTAPEDTTIMDAARIMSREKISSLIITGKPVVPVGIITDKDLRSKVIARGRDVNEPVSSIMSSTLIRVDADEYCFEALLRMIHYNIHHILVIENGSLKGLVSNHDFMLMQGTSPAALIKEIEKQQDIGSLAGVTPKLIKVVSTLMREGAHAGNIAGLITEITEKILNKIIDHIERKIGPSPLPYTLFLYGDGGRRELTLNPKLKIGIAYEDTNNLSVVRRTEQYFAEYRDILKINFNHCNLRNNGNADSEVIPSEHIKSNSDWINHFRRLSDDPFKHRPDVDLFDMRSIRGDEDSLQQLRDSLFKILNDDLMDYIAAATVENRPPIGFFRKFVVEKDGVHKNEMNLYIKGIRPIVDSIRLFTLQKEIMERSTMKRIQRLGERYSFEEASDIGHAFEYLLMLLMHNQIEQLDKGLSPDDFIDPEALGTLEKKTLKESFQLIANLHDMIEKGYRTERIS